MKHLPLILALTATPVWSGNLVTEGLADPVVAPHGPIYRIGTPIIDCRTMTTAQRFTYPMRASQCDRRGNKPKPRCKAKVAEHSGTQPRFTLTRCGKTRPITIEQFCKRAVCGVVKVTRGDQ